MKHDWDGRHLMKAEGKAPREKSKTKSCQLRRITSEVERTFQVSVWRFSELTTLKNYLLPTKDHPCAFKECRVLEKIDRKAEKLQASTKYLMNC